jgi:hypothetical protein
MSLPIILRLGGIEKNTVLGEGEGGGVGGGGYTADYWGTAARNKAFNPVQILHRVCFIVLFTCVDCVLVQFCVIADCEPSRILPFPIVGQKLSRW